MNEKKNKIGADGGEKMKKILLVIVFLFAVLCVTFWGNNNALGSDRFEATDLEDAVIGSGEVTTYIVTKPR